MKVKTDYYKMAINAPEITKVAKPGQFVHIRVTDGYDPLLRRPFSIHRVSNQKPVTRNQIQILYEVVGKGTEILSQKKAGDCLDIIGPLGNGFNLLPNTHNLTPILVAGGIGVVPLLFLAEELKKSKLNPIILLGAKTKERLLCEREFKDIGCNVEISTDDGSKGFKGKVTDLLKNYLSTYQLINLSTIYVCGPKEMLKEVALISKRYKIPSFGSLEENLGCGIGACLGCAIKTKEGYKRVCKDGPVFDLKEIIW